jgi:hypothetical protein
MTTPQIKPLRWPSGQGLKLSIEKHGKTTTVQLTYDTAKKPMEHSFTEAELESLIGILQTALRSGEFSLTLTLGK